MDEVKDESKSKDGRAHMAVTVTCESRGPYVRAYLNDPEGKDRFEIACCPRILFETDEGFKKKFNEMMMETVRMIVAGATGDPSTKVDGWMVIDGAPVSHAQAN